MSRIVVETRRGNVVEARHHVHAVAVSGGEIVESCGDPALVTYLRSSAKPLHEPETIPTAIDGCRVVTHALTLERMAHAFARLARLDGGPRVAEAMRAHPELIRAGARPAPSSCAWGKVGSPRESPGDFSAVCRARGSGSP